MHSSNTLCVFCNFMIWIYWYKVEIYCYVVNIYCYLIHPCMIDIDFFMPKAKLLTCSDI